MRLVPEISVMTPAELDLILDWAGSEGWNPGLDDAGAFWGADPAGFFLARVDGQPAAAVSVVNHSDDFAFLGLYICHPEFRGQGIGLAVWTAALAHAGGRTVGLDGVPDQQANYVASGFAHAGETTRFVGHVPAQPFGRPLHPDDMPALLAWDVRATGIARAGFLTTWLQGSDTRRTLVVGAQGYPRAMATGRRCRDGIKIGPLRAQDPQTALSLIGALAGGQQVMVDVHSSSPELATALRDAGFTAGFQTARMYRGQPPATDPARCEAVATLELG